MTYVHLYRAKGRLRGFSVVGHAGMAPAGEDIVCAGLSAIAQTAALSLSAVAGIKPALHIGDGYLSVRLPGGLSPRQRDMALVILQTAQVGFSSIRTAYPQYVKIT